jgi:hypothetical protein
MTKLFEFVCSLLSLCKEIQIFLKASSLYIKHFHLKWPSLLSLCLHNCTFKFTSGWCSVGHFQRWWRIEVGPRHVSFCNERSGFNHYFISNGIKKRDSTIILKIQAVLDNRQDWFQAILNDALRINEKWRKLKWFDIRHWFLDIPSFS